MIPGTEPRRTIDQRRATIAVWLACASGILIGALVFGVLLDEDATDELPIDSLGVAIELIEENYWRDPDLADLADDSIAGMIRGLSRQYEDPFSSYLDPKTYKVFDSHTSGQFEGIGLAVLEVKKGLRVSVVYKGSPADEAGIEVDDVITAVEGESIAGVDSKVSTNEIKGPPGTEVTITVRSPSGSERELTVERAAVRIPAVVGRLTNDGEAAYVRLLAFSTGAHGDLRAEIERLDRKGAEGLVLDLRGNGGGLLDEAVLTASIFVEEGIIASTEGRTSARTDHDASGDAIPERPIVILIDGNTASASEILAAALEHYGLATTVGEKSFGKGTFQEVIELPNGGALDLTRGEYLTASGESVAGEGIKPDVEARDRRSTKRDEALERALEVLGGELDG